MKRRLVLIHGFMERPSMWDPLLPLPENEIKIIELPGHGTSDNFPPVLHMELAADQIAIELQKVKTCRNLLIGHSMGGYICGALARKYPELVDGIIMFQSSARPDSPPKKIDRDRAVTAVRDNKSRYCKTMIKGLFNEENENLFAEKIKELSTDAAAMDTEAIVASLLGMKMRNSSLETFKDRDFFLAYILGDVDKRLPLEQMKKEINEVDPDFHAVIRNCGHMAQWEAPALAKKHLSEAIKLFDASAS